MQCSAFSFHNTPERLDGIQPRLMKTEQGHYNQSIACRLCVGLMVDYCTCVLRRPRKYQVQLARLNLHDGTTRGIIVYDFS